MSNQLRAAIIALAQSAFPLLVLLGVDLSDAAIAAIMLVITNTITLLALIFPGPVEAVLVDSGEVKWAPALEQVDLMTLEPDESRSVIKP